MLSRVKSKKEVRGVGDELKHRASTTSQSMPVMPSTGKPTFVSRATKHVTLTEDGGAPSPRKKVQLPTSPDAVTKTMILDLSRREITHLPSALWKFTSLQALNLHQNHLKSISTDVGKLTSLTALLITENDLTKLPKGLKTLSNLSVLDARQNRIIQVSSSICHLKALTKLSLEQNQLACLPSGIGKLENLQQLLLRNNHFRSLPDELGDVTTLQTIDMYQNLLRRIPPSIGKLSNLRSLDLRFNGISELPDEFAELESLTMLDVGHNEFTTFPEALAALTSLTDLRADSNKLVCLPPCIGKLVGLKELGLGDNLLEEIPAEIGTLVNLRKLIVQRNNLTDLPQEFVNLTSLAELDLRTNPLGTLSFRQGMWKGIVAQLPALTTLRQGEVEIDAAAEAAKREEQAKAQKGGPPVSEGGGADGAFDEDKGATLSSRRGGRVRVSTKTVKDGEAKPTSLMSMFGAPAGGAAPPANNGTAGGDNGNGETSPKAETKGKDEGEEKEKEKDTSESAPGQLPSRGKKKSKSGKDTSDSLADLVVGLDTGSLSWLSDSTKKEKGAANWLEEALASAAQGEGAKDAESDDEDDDDDVLSPRTPASSVASARDSRKAVVAYAAVEDLNKTGLQRAKKKPAMTASGKPMFQQEDTHYCEFPFQEHKSKGLFCVFDGHAGKNCSTAATTLFPKEWAKNVKRRQYRNAVDLSTAFHVTFLKVDEQLDEHQYEGCTGTAVYVWRSGSNRYVQAANVGDSSAIMCRDGKAVWLSKDHKLADPSEKTRIQNMGVNISEGQTRLNGIAVSRALGDRFAKVSNSGMSAVPYISDSIKVEPTDTCIIVASDGLWDVIGPQKAVDIAEAEDTADAKASCLLKTALQSSKCQDNVTVVVILLH